MSVSQMKKSVASLKSYLGKDAYGVELLGAVTRSAHEVRTASREQSERAEKSEARIAEVVKERDALALRCEEQRQEIEKLRATAEQAVARANIATSKIESAEKKEPFHTKLEEFGQRDVESLFNSLNHEFKMGGPHSSRAKKLSVGAATVRMYDFNILDLLPDMSEHGFAVLGRWMLAQFLVFQGDAIRLDVPTSLKMISNKSERWDRISQKVLRLFRDRFNFDDLREINGGGGGNYTYPVGTDDNIYDIRAIR